MNKDEIQAEIALVEYILKSKKSRLSYLYSYSESEILKSLRKKYGKPKNYQTKKTFILFEMMYTKCLIKHIRIGDALWDYFSVVDGNAMKYVLTCDGGTIHEGGDIGDINPTKCNILLQKKLQS